MLMPMPLLMPMLMLLLLLLPMPMLSLSLIDYTRRMLRTRLASMLSLLLCACGGNTADNTPDATQNGSPDAAPMVDGSPPVPDAAPMASSCFDNVYQNPVTGPDYDPYGPVVGSHCLGTNHQDIANIQRVVFLGDSMTVGTPPTLARDYYRSELADRLAARFSLQAPSALWKSVNPLTGRAAIQDSGDFSSCAEWGARTNDLAAQTADCFPVDQRTKATLVVITMGGNDLAAIAKDGIDGATPTPQLWLDAEAAVQFMRDAVAWFYDDPQRFPNGVFVTFANVYEYTDSTIDLGSCVGAAAAGLDGSWPNPDELRDIALWTDEQYMSIAVDTDTDMLFLLEEFCGHGFHNDDPNAPCYRGPGTARWFDDTCIHPNPTGHGHIADMFMAVVEE